MGRHLKHNTEGSLQVQIQGAGTERFLTLCGFHGLELWNVKPEEDGAVCLMALPAFYQAAPLAKKAGVRLRICQKKGLPFWLHRNRKRKGLLLGAAFFFLLLYGLSLFLWNITFEGNAHYSSDTLLRYLREHGIFCGMRKSRISCEELEENLRSDFPGIAWVSAGVSGTRLLVKIKESEAVSRIPEPDETPCDVAASRPGVITSLVVRQGRALVKAGDSVEEGQVLVSSKLTLTDDAGETVEEVYVRADADVYAQTAYFCRQSLPPLRRVTVRTGKKRRGVQLQIGSLAFRFLFPFSEGEDWIWQTEDVQLCLGEDFYLPVRVGWVEGESCSVYERPYTQEEVQEAAEDVQRRYLENLMEKGVQIIENNVKILENGYQYEICAEASGIQQIGFSRPVQPESGERARQGDEEKTE